MAKVRGPLLSLEARGSIGSGTLSFYNRGYYKTCVKKCPKTPPPKKEEQLKNQNIWKILAWGWNILEPICKNWWKMTELKTFASENNPYKARPHSIHAFYHVNYNRIKQGKRILKRLDLTDLLPNTFGTNHFGI